MLQCDASKCPVSGASLDDEAHCTLTVVDWVYGSHKSLGLLLASRIQHHRSDLHLILKDDLLVYPNVLRVLKPA